MASSSHRTPKSDGSNESGDEMLKSEPQEKMMTTTDQRPAFEQIEMEVPGQDLESNNMYNKKCLCDPIWMIIQARKSLDNGIHSHRYCLSFVVKATLLLGYMAYFSYAMFYSFGDEGSLRLLIGTILVFVGITCNKLKKPFNRYVIKIYREARCCKSLRFHLSSNRALIQRIISIIVLLAISIFILVDVIIVQPRALISLGGLLVIIFVVFFFSKDPAMVDWRPVLWGVCLQTIFALIVLRTDWGYSTFEWLGNRITEFLGHSDEGSKFVFGKTYRDHFFAFQVLPVIIFFSSIISVLYYLGWLQVAMKVFAYLMQCSLGTSAMESMHAALNIFVGWGETLSFIQPLMDELTLSEIHTIMTNGFATVSGSTLFAYTLYGAPANHLLSASVMSAPAALAISKLFYPEVTKKKKEKKQWEIEGQGRNIVDAASVGAVGALSVVGYILASVIAFFAILGFVNATLTWIGDRVGLIPPEYPPLTFQLICSYLFWPLVFLMGVEAADCRIVARMVGIKTFINEFFAYEDLGRVIRNRAVLENFNGTWHWDIGDNIKLESTNITLTGGVISDRSAVICTYALCGFANVTALGIMIGAMTAVAPSRKDDIVRVAFRALVSGCMACFFTACISGLLTRL